MMPPAVAVGLTGQAQAAEYRFAEGEEQHQQHQGEQQFTHGHPQAPLRGYVFQRRQVDGGVAKWVGDQKHQYGNGKNIHVQLLI